MRSTCIECDFFSSRTDQETSRYKCGPLVLVDIENVTLELQARVMRIAKASIDENDDDETRTAIMNAAMQEASKISFYSKDGGKAFRKLDGAALLLKKAISKFNPNFTTQNAVDILQDSRNKSEFDFALSALVLRDPTAKKPIPPTVEGQNEDIDANGLLEPQTSSLLSADDT